MKHGKHLQAASVKKYLTLLGYLCQCLIMDSSAKKYIEHADIEDILKFSFRIKIFGDTVR